MHADVADAAAAPGALGIRPPFGLLLTAPLDRRCEPALARLDERLADAAELARRDASSRLLDHRIRGIRMRQAVQEARRTHRVTQRDALVERRRRGLVGQHVKTVAER